MYIRYNPWQKCADLDIICNMNFGELFWRLKGGALIDKNWVPPSHLPPSPFFLGHKTFLKIFFVEVEFEKWISLLCRRSDSRCVHISYIGLVQAFFIKILQNFIL